MVTLATRMDHRISLILLLFAVAAVNGQAILDATQEIESFRVVSDIRYRFATTQMVSVVRNKGTESREIGFDVTLPKEAFIMHFAMAIDGKVYEGEVKEKKEAKRQYDAAVSSGQSAGHVAQAARHANLFTMSVNVAAGSVVNFTLTYQELLKRTFGLYQHEIHVRPGQPVEDFLVKVFIKDKVPITLIRTPSLKKDFLITNEAEEKVPEFVNVVQNSPTTAYVEYVPTLLEQGKEGLNARFLLQYDVDHSEKGDVFVVDGYFVHFYAPELPPMAKDIIFVLDRSGSMMGRKMQQLKSAMKSILGDLMPQDRFNIISFSDSDQLWKTGMSPVDNDVKKEAIDFVQRMEATGGTNINDALVQAVKSLQHRENKSGVPLIFFLTDGQATTGVTTSSSIKSNILKSNEGVVSIFSLAFGNDADYDLLKGISAQNSGFARKIYEASDSALQVSGLYKEIATVVAKDLQINYLNSSVDQFSLTKTEFPVVFNGTEIIICGRLDEAAHNLEMDITAIKKDGDLSLKFISNELTELVIDDPDVEESTLFNTPRDFAGIVERMWAFLNIKQMLKDREKAAEDSESLAEDLKKKIIDLAIKYKFVTPLTSMVVTKPENNGEPSEKLESGLTDADEVQTSPAKMQGAIMHSQIMQGGMSGHRVRGMRRKTNVRRYGLSHSVAPAGSMNDLGIMGPVGQASVGASHTRAIMHLMAKKGRRGGRRNKGPHRGRRVLKRRRKGGRRKGGKGKGGRTPGGQRGKKGQPKVILAVITLETSSESYCILPRRWLPGLYILMEKPSQVANSSNSKYPVVMGLNAIKKANSLMMVRLSDGTWVRTVNLTTEGWKYSTGSDTQISLVNNGSDAVLEQHGKPVVTISVIRKTRKAWYLAINLTSELEDGFSSLVKFVRPKSGKRIIQRCGATGKSFTVMGTVSGLKAVKFKTT